MRVPLPGLGKSIVSTTSACNSAQPLFRNSEAALPTADGYVDDTGHLADAAEGPGENGSARNTK